MVHVTGHLGVHGDRPVIRSRALDACDAQIVEPVQGGCAANSRLGGLHMERITRPAAIPRDIEAPVAVQLQELLDVLRRDAPVLDALWQADEISGKAVAAHVARLPHPVHAS